MGGGEALAKLRKLDPAGSYDLNHIYIGAGQAVPVGNEDTQKPAGGRPLVGLIDRGAGRHPALDGLIVEQRGFAPGGVVPGGHGTRSEEHTSELQSLMRISYAVFCL